MLLAVMLAMVLAAAVPALAQSVTQVGSGNQACVQTAIQAEVGKVQISQYGDNVNIQNIAQECNVNVAQVEDVVASASPAAAPPAKPTAATASGGETRAQRRVPPRRKALPETGGASLIVLGAGGLLVAGLVARRMAR
ncbi:MAG TPA: hypothetical protein VFX77_05630 [Rubrobacter sp.]|nr:hypothetical protein [Rubrobacter sp.]